MEEIKYDANQADRVENLEQGVEPLKSDVVVHEAESKGQKLSGYEQLGWFATVQKFPLATLYCVIPSICAAADGYQTGINGSLIAQQGFVKQFATITTKAGKPALAPQVITAISAIQSTGLFFGMISMPFVAARFGRKAAFYSLWCLLALSVTLECVAKRWEVWFVAKLFSGLGVGSIQFMTPLYIAECSPVRIRGVLLFTYDIWWSVGGLIAAVALQVMNDHDPTDWHIPVYTQWGLLGMMMLIYLSLPESPFWCANNDKVARGKKALAQLYRGVENFNLEQQWEVLVLTVEHEREVALSIGKGKWLDIFRGVDGFRTICCAWIITAAQFLGLNILNSYSAYFFSVLGLKDPFSLVAITKAPQILVGILCAFIVDRIGRRNLACFWLTVLWFMDLGIAIIGCIEQSSVTNSLLIFFASVFFVAVTAATSIGYGFLGELPAQRHRAHTAGFSAALGAVFGTINNVIGPYMLSKTAWNWGEKAFWLYVGLGAPFAFGSWFIVPEPARRSAAELDELFERKIKPWRFAKTKTATQLAVQAREESQGTVQE